MRMNGHYLYLQRVKRGHSTQHARDNKDYTDLSLNKPQINRPSAGSTYHAAGLCAALSVQYVQQL